MGDFGNRPNLHPNQRVTLETLEAVRDAPFDERSRADGSAFGACEGVLSAMGATYEEVGSFKSIRFGEGVLCAFRNVATTKDRAVGGFAHYDPTDANQTQTIVEVSAYEGSTGVFWWRAALVETDLGNYAEIQAGFPQGKLRADKMNLRTRVYFTATVDFDTPPGDGETWYRLAFLDWTDTESDPVVTFCHAFDQGFHLSSSEARAVGYWLGQTMMDNRNEEDTGGRTYAVERSLALLTNIILKMKSSAHVFDPVTGEITTPGDATLLDDTEIDGLVELGAAVAALQEGHGTRLNLIEDEIELHTTQIGDLQTTQLSARVLYSAEVASTGVKGNENGSMVSIGPVAVSRDSEGTYIIEPSIALDANSLVVLVRPQLAGVGIRNVWVDYLSSPTRVRVRIYDGASGEGGLVDCPFSVLITGDFD